MLGLVTLALIVIGVAGSTLLERYLLNRVDSQLRATTNSLVSGAGIGSIARSSPVGSFYVALTESDGELTQGSGLIPRPGDTSASPPKLAALTQNFALAHDQKPFTVSSVSGSRHWRVYITPLQGGSSLTVAFPLDDVNSTVNRLIWIDLVVSVIVLILLAGIGYFMVRSSLRRLVEV